MISRSTSTISDLAKPLHLLFRDSSNEGRLRVTIGNITDCRLKLRYLGCLYVLSCLQRRLAFDHGSHGTPRCRAQAPLPHQPIWIWALMSTRRIFTSTRISPLCRVRQRGAWYALEFLPVLVHSSQCPCTKHYFSEVEDIEPLLVQHPETGTYFQ